MTKSEKIHKIFSATELVDLQVALEHRIKELQAKLNEAEEKYTFYPEKESEAHIKGLKKMIEDNQSLLNQIL